MSRMALSFHASNVEQGNVFVFLDFLDLIFNFQKSRRSLFCYGVPYIVSIFFTFQFVSSQLCPGTYFHIRYIDFSVVEKLNDFSLFFDFRHFFVLQLISFKIRQYREFAKEPFQELPIITVDCRFLPVLVLVLNDFCFEYCSVKFFL